MEKRCDCCRNVLSDDGRCYYCESVEYDPDK